MEVDGRPPLSPQMMEVDEAGSSSEFLRTLHHHHHACGNTTSKRRRPVRRVTFAEEALLYRSNRTQEDVKEMWYTKQELASFKDERREIIRLLKKVKFDLSRVNQEHICLRGYEPYFSVAMNKATKYARELVMTVVFVEQSRQRMMGVFEPESLRERCCQASQWARETGMELGHTDALLNPLRVECLGREQQPSDFINGAQIRISTVDDSNVKQLESTLAMMKSILNQCDQR